MTSPYQDVIVIIPGILGSALERRGDPVWGLNKRAFGRILFSFGRAVHNLTLREDPCDLDDLGDGVVATHLLHDLHLIPGFWKIDGYTKIVDALRRDLTLIPGENLFEFPYDWRRDNRVSARKLQRQSMEWLTAWRKKSGNDGAKLIFLAHSMGGVIARYSLEVLGGWRHTRHLVTFGTPYRGAISALDTLINGVSVGLGPLTLSFSDFVRSLTSVYQLCPMYPCYDPGDGKLVRIGEAEGIPNVNPALARDALAFHRDIQAAVETNRRDPLWEEHQYQIFPFVGTRQKTAQSAVRYGDGAKILNTINGRPMDGDGTVPRVSATPLELSSAHREIYSATKHGGLQNATHVIHHLHGLLTRSEISYAEFFADSPVELGVEVGDCFAEEQPIHIQVTATDDPGELTLSFEDAASNQVMRRVSVDGDRLEGGVLFDPLPEGTYRITVAGDDAVVPVTDVFEVVSPDTLAAG